MNTRPIITEEELHAFIDGELDPSRREVIEDLLREDAALARRVAQFRQDKERLASIYAPLLERPLPMSWVSRVRQSQTSRPLRRQSATITAIAASLILVVGGVWLASLVSTPSQPRSLVNEALAARSGELQPDTTISSGMDALSAGREISTVLAMKAKAPMLTRFGYRLASIKSYEADSKRRTIELVYANSGGKEVTLYLSRSIGAPRFDQYESGGMRICIWQDDVVGMVLMGHLSAAEMQRLATLAYDGLTA